MKKRARKQFMVACLYFERVNNLLVYMHRLKRNNQVEKAVYLCMKGLGIVLVSFFFQFYSYSQCCTDGKNLLLNGDFEDRSFNANNRPLGFETDNLWDLSVFISPGYYIVLESRSYGACSSTPQYDKTKGAPGGLFLWYDVSNDRVISAADPAIAYKPKLPNGNAGTTNLIQVKKNTYYIFSCWIRDLAREPDCVSGGAPIMGLRINGTDIAEVDLSQYTSPCCPDWVQLCAEWFSGDTNIAQIQIESRSNFGFTDLGIDDVYFGQSVSALQISSNFLRDTVLCGNDSVTFNLPSKARKVRWNDGSVARQRTIKTTGIYSVTITDSCNNSIIDTAIVTLKPGAKLAISDTLICPGDSIQFTKPNNTSNWFFNGLPNNNTSITAKQERAYTYQFTDNCNNIVRDTFTVGFIKPTTFALSDTIICNGEAVNLTINENYPQYNWSTGAKSKTISVRDAGIYIATGVDICKRSFSDSATIQTKPCFCRIFMPNAFTPDVNGINDWILPVLECPASKYYLAIYNRWGQKVFETTDPLTKGWNGVYLNKPSQQEVFAYYLVVEQQNKRKILKGNITLLR